MSTATEARTPGTKKSDKTGQSNGAATTTVKIQQLNVGKMKLRLRGTAPLMVHNFSDKSRREMLAAQTGKNKKTAKEPRSPVEEFLGAFYVVEGLPDLVHPTDNPTGIPTPNIDEQSKQKTFDPDQIAKFCKEGKFGVPITGFKNALISACRNTDFSMAGMKQTLFVTGENNRDFAIIEGGTPVMDNRICRLAGAARTPIERFRPRWDTWETTINVEFDANMLTVDEVANLVAVAGFYVGICEGRPERSSIGYGRWELINN
jgi:hypothetical protein